MSSLNTVIFSELIEPQYEQIFLIKKRLLIVNALEFPGCFNAELLSPIPKIRQEWITLIKFENEESLNLWLNSSTTKQCLYQLNNYIKSTKKQFLPSFNRQVSYLITTIVSPEKEAEYLEWENKIGQEMKTNPGFIGKEVSNSKSIYREKNKKVWATILKFNDQENLRHWLNSENRQKLLAEGKKIFDYSVVNEFPRGFGNWFNLEPRDGKKTPSWKMPLIVQMALYPMVLFQARLNPFLPSFPPPVITLINTFWGCFLMQYVLVPSIQKLMNFWLYPQTNKNVETNLIGVILAAIYLGMICYLAVNIY